MREAVDDQPANEVEAIADPRAKLTALMREIAAGGAAGLEAADRLPVALKAMAVGHPTEATRDFLKDLLEGRTLDGYADSMGLSCRAAVINAQLSLGFPLALEVNPDDLAWLREVTKDRESGPNVSRGWTFFFALVSMAWSAAVLVLLKDGWPFTVPFLIGGLHGLAALATSSLASPADPIATRRKFKRVYQVLKAFGWLGPIVSAIPPIVLLGEPRGNLNPLAAGLGVFLVGLICATPAMVTAVTSGFAGKRLVPEDEVLPAPVPPPP